MLRVQSRTLARFVTIDRAKDWLGLTRRLEPAKGLRLPWVRGARQLRFDSVQRSVSDVG